jgi:hypothetical protein
MNGKDVMDALANIDDDLILDAKSQPRSIPRWLKWGSMAVCLCCAVLVTLLCVEKLRSGDDAGTALTPGTDQTESAFPEASSGEEETVIPEASSAEEETAIPEDSTQSNASMEAISVLDYTDFDYYSCEGNLVLIDGSYYTLTDNGPEPVELQNVSTEIELYGTWEVDFDYGILDGELVLHNNTSTEWYTIIDGEQVKLNEYYASGGSLSVDDITWITPSVAYAYIVPGRNDLVMLTIQRLDQDTADTYNYDLFYDLATGEIYDPLSNVPDLFSYGSMSGVYFNTALTRGIVYVFDAEYLDNGETFVDGYTTYICDLETGEMWSLADRMAQFLPEGTDDGTTYQVREGGCLWADDDTLLFWIQECTNDGEEVYTDWLCSYDCSTETLNYTHRDVAYVIWEQDGSCPYLVAHIDGTTNFEITDAATGSCYVLETDFSTYDWYSYSHTDDRALCYSNNLVFYLVDAPSHSYVELTCSLEQPPDDIHSVYLLTDDWICIQTESQLYFYRIPEGLRWIDMKEDTQISATATDNETAPTTSQDLEEAERTTITDAVLGLSIEVPVEYQADIVCNSADTVLFSFYDPVSNAAMGGGGGGFVWSICAYPVEEADLYVGDDLCPTDGIRLVAPEGFVLGQTEEYVFAVILPSDVRYLPDVAESKSSYQEYCKAGCAILSSFLSCNGITGSDGWEEHYMGPVNARDGT